MTLTGLVSLVFDFIGLVPHKINQKQAIASESADQAPRLIEIDWCCVCLSRLKEKDDTKLDPVHMEFISPPNLCYW
ncbi:uncharacterized protein LOC129312163 isoform X2 [Prosopis cineraria]|uniref:uncharacterized protein LOC129312163 isoform X2 n=1 Tax=Prosopis cineraria TaxID=364024 RepID=UPI00240FF38E|nr:uncharacterized protein LOC129312163 isoform X2 [Prosopis cineraria]